MPRNTVASWPEPAAAGTLAERPTQHLLVYARDRALSGTLEVDDGQGDGGTVVLSRGIVNKIRADRAAALLGAVVYELGLIDAKTLDSSLRALAETRGKRHGEILLAGHAITYPQLSAALMEQTLRKLTYLHGLPVTTSFAFYDQFDALPGWPHDGPRVDPLAAVWRGCRDFVAKNHLDAVLGRLGTSSWRVPKAALIANFCLDSETLALVERLREPMPIVDFFELAGGARPRAERLLYVLAITKQLEKLGRTKLPSAAPVEPSAKEERPPAPAGVGQSGTYARTISFELRTPYAGDSQPPGGRPTPTPGPPLPPVDPGALTRLEITSRALKIESETLYEALDVPPDAPDEQIRAAYFRLSRRWRSELLPDSLGDVHSLCKKVRARMDEAQRTLTDPGARRRYDARLR